MSKEESVINSIINNMVFVKGGPMIVQSNNSAINNQTSINLSPYYINRFPVSKVEWSIIMGGNYRDDSDNYPIVNVSWYDCFDFINRLNRLTKGAFRLPAKIEWEYAAYGAELSHGFIYSGSNNPDEVAWYKEGLQGAVHEIGLKNPNELGLYDMSGNIWEWCQDSCPYHNNPLNFKNDILEDYKQAHRVIKGGSSGSKKDLSRIDFTYGQHPDYRGCYVGFRLAF